ncbi:MAG: hypothetical protein R3E79_52830 [Caldilineaceae bacterium]
MRDYVHAHLSEEITLETLAALVHLSPYHCAKFKAATGLRPINMCAALSGGTGKELG